MAGSSPNIAVIGAGMGGLAVASALRQVGANVTVYEQASRFGRVGAGIQMLPNSSHVLRGLGVLDHLAQKAFKPYSHLNRVWDTGAVKRELPMPEDLYGAPFLCMHRADLHEALLSVVPHDDIQLGKKLIGLDHVSGGVKLSFADGTTAEADAVVGADGVHSLVREIIVGQDKPIHRGRIAYRAVFDTALMNGGDIGPSRTKWWGEDRHIVMYYVNAERSQLYFVTSVPEPGDWITKESWSAKGDVRDLRAAYEGFHPDVMMVLNACPDCHKWAILERDPLPHWSDGRVVLLGDACHPMTPYMAQGAATSIEDAAVLARCVKANGSDLEGAFRQYEANRKPRTSRIQAISSANTWMQGGNEDTSWLYGYDAWNVPLIEASALATV